MIQLAKMSPEDLCIENIKKIGLLRTFFPPRSSLLCQDLSISSDFSRISRPEKPTELPGQNVAWKLEDLKIRLLFFGGHGVNLLNTHTIHVWYICLHENHRNQLNIGI